MLKQIGALLLILVLLAGCVPTSREAVDGNRLTFAVNVVVQDDGQAKVTAGLRNDGRSSFNGSGADSGDLHTRTELQPVEPLEPDESTFRVGKPSCLQACTNWPGARPIRA